MSLRIDHCGWGRGLIDPAAPISSSGDPARRSRELALRQLLEVLSDGRLVDVLRPDFAAGGDDHVHARFVRLIVLIRRFLDHELPALRRVLRCQTTTVAQLSAAPRGGRVDVLATWRRAPAACLMGTAAEWVVQRTQYFVETSTNLLVAAILHEVAACLVSYRHHVSQHWRLHLREDDVLHRAARELRRFFDITPLGLIPRHSLRPIELMMVEAARRRAEFARIASLVDWWREFLRFDLAMLRSAGEPEVFTTVSVHGCYELICATALVLALRDRCAVQDGDLEPHALTLRSRSGVVSLQLGAKLAPVSFGRPPTLVLELRPDNRAATRLIVEARNAGDLAAQEFAGRLVLQQQTSGDRDAYLLLTPGDAVPPGFESIRWRRFASPLRKGAPLDAVKEWHALLDELLAPIEEGA